MSESVVERLVKTNPDMEVWWDSSPLIFDRWVTRMVGAAPDGQKAELEAQLGRLFNRAEPAKSCGSTSLRPGSENFSPNKGCARLA